MRLFACTLFSATVLVCQPVLAINKCTTLDGKITFQDAPCISAKAEAIEAKPASGRAAPSAQGAETARLEGIIAASQRSRRAQDLRERLLPDAERAVTDHRAACAEKQQAFAAEQYAYRQNLYGKTHAAQIASEMAASAAICDTKDRELKEAADVLARECVALRCRS